jgi:cytochrome c oxidase assembly factor CtaG
VIPLATSTSAVGTLSELVPLALLGLAYAKRVRTLGRQQEPVPAWRQTCFYGAVLTIALTLTMLGGAGQEMILAHTAAELLLGDIAALLIVLGLTGPVIAPLLRVKALGRLRVLAHPLIAFPLWAIDLYAWHLRVFYESALRHPGVHALEHTMLLVFGINMWMCLVGPLPMPSWFGSGAKLVYVVAVRFTGAVLANVFMWSGTVFYSYYSSGDATRHISPIADQNLAGAVMMVEQSVLTLGLLCWLFLRSAHHGEQRQDPRDFGRSRVLS